MSDTENNNIVNPEVENQQEEHQVSEIEQRALEMGWKPRDNFDGSDDDFIDAKEFVRRKPLFDKIESNSRENKQLRKELEALKGHYTKVQENAVKTAMARLEAQRAQAVSDGDGAAFKQLDNQLKDASKQLEEIKAVQTSGQSDTSSPQEFVDWQNKNKWYQKDDTMTTFADAYGIKLQKQGLSPTEVLSAVEKKVKEEFPHKFTNANKRNAPDVDASSSKGTPGKLRSVEASLSEEERTVMHRLTSGKNPVMTKEQYLKDLQELNRRG